MTTYNLSKGQNNDVNGQILKDWVNTNKSNIHNITIKDTGASTITNIANTFYNFNDLISVDFSNFNTAKTVNMANTFYNCTNLVDISNFYTNKVSDMTGMFTDCNNITNDTLSNIANSMPNSMNINNKLIYNIGITADRFSNDDKSVLFSKGYLDCDNTFDVVHYGVISSQGTSLRMVTDRYGDALAEYMNFRISAGVTTLSIQQTDIEYAQLFSVANMFYNGTTIEESDIDINAENVIDANSMFYNCYNLTNLTFTNFNTINMVNMPQFCYNCTNLTSVSNLDTSNVIDMTSMFMGCTNLVDVPQFDTSNVVDMSNMFYRCNNLSNASVQNIINMCLNSNVPSGMRNLYTDNQYSPFGDTIFDSTYYSNRLTELDNAGWEYDSNEVDTLEPIGP